MEIERILPILGIIGAGRKMRLERTGTHKARQSRIELGIVDDPVCQFMVFMNAVFPVCQEDIRPDLADQVGQHESNLLVVRQFTVSIGKYDRLTAQFISKRMRFLFFLKAVFCRAQVRRITFLAAGQSDRDDLVALQSPGCQYPTAGQLDIADMAANRHPGFSLALFTHRLPTPSFQVSVLISLRMSAQVLTILKPAAS